MSQDTQDLKKSEQRTIPEGSGKTFDLYNDEFIWLEEVESKEALTWTQTRTEKTIQHFSDDVAFKDAFDFSMKLSADKKKLPLGFIEDKFYYNFWKDDQYPEGLLRRCPSKDIGTESPNWLTLIDFQKLNAKENSKWTYAGMEFNPYDKSKALINLSAAGKDACEIREFDLEIFDFVKDGFYFDCAKQSACYFSKDEVAIERGNENASSYARDVFVLRRGDTASLNKRIFELPADQVMVYPFTKELEKNQYIKLLITRPSFFDCEIYLVQDNRKLIQLKSPRKSYLIGYWNQGFVLQLTADWLNYKTDDLVWVEANRYLNGDPLTQEATKLAWRNQDNCFVQMARCSNERLFVELLVETESRCYEFFPDGTKKMLAAEISNTGSDVFLDIDDKEKSEIYLRRNSFLEPFQIFRLNSDSSITKVFQGTEFIHSPNYVVEFHKARSADGSLIPYKIVRHKNTKASAPAWVYGYGGFRSSMSSSYLSIKASQWLDHGGIFVLTHLRGGLEYGTDWHTQVLKLNRKKCYEDFAGVIKDLHNKNYSSPEQTLIEGRSNGGLLVGATATLYPELIKAVICGVPLLDMVRYHKLLAGISWADEYGTVEDSEEMRDYILSYSPYQNIPEDKKLPVFLLRTSTYDDRVHPGHARKMAARLMNRGHQVYYYEEFEGGHSGNVKPEISARATAVEFAFAKKFVF